MTVPVRVSLRFLMIGFALIFLGMNFVVDSFKDEPAMGGGGLWKGLILTLFGLIVALVGVGILWSFYSESARKKRRTDSLSKKAAGEDEKSSN